MARLRAQGKLLQENDGEMNEEQDDSEMKEEQDGGRDERVPWTR